MGLAPSSLVGFTPYIKSEGRDSFTMGSPPADKDSDVPTEGTESGEMSPENVIEEHKEVYENHEEEFNEFLDEVLADVETPEEEGEDAESSGGFNRRTFMKAGLAVGAASALAGCQGFNGDSNGGNGGTNGDVPSPHVKPGELDDYYGIWSGGQSGEMRVFGIPSMRVLTRIPMFAPDPGKGWGHDDHSTQVLKDGVNEEVNPTSPQWRGGGDGPSLTSGDTHHPVLSETDGDYDGKYAFINDKAHGRIGRANLKYFEADGIVDVPNVQSVHAMAVQSPDSKYVYGGCEFRTPWPNDGSKDPSNSDNYDAAWTAIDPESMNVEFQVLVSGNMDNADTGKNGEWAFSTGYNSEEAFGIEGMSRNDRDYVKAFNIPNIEAHLERGNFEEIGGARVIDGKKNSRLSKHPESDAGVDDPVVYYIPVPKSPHGMDCEPTGTYAIANGKLSPTCSVIEIDKIADVDNLEDAVVGQPKVGLGPLHTTFDDRGHAYTTLFIDSQVAKWDIEQAAEEGFGSEVPIKGKIDVHYNPGHIQAAKAETVNPTGDWLVSLSKLSKDRYLPVGPAHPDNDQLIYIGNDGDDEQGGMALLHDGPVYPEPHDAVIAAAEDLNPAKTWDKEDYTSEGSNFPSQVTPAPKEYVEEADSRVERVDDSTVEISMSAKRSSFGLKDFTVQEGDEIEMTVTNIETSPDISHGVHMPRYDFNLKIDPQDTQVVTFTADEPGVYWMYCTWFCSALHLEMRSRMIVEPAD